MNEMKSLWLLLMAEIRGIKRKSDQTANLIRGTGRWSINFCPLQLLHFNSGKKKLPPSHSEKGVRWKPERERGEMREREREREGG